jgi:hypothetical protein
MRNKIYLVSMDWANNVAGAYADNHDEFDSAVSSDPSLFGTGYVNKINHNNDPYGRNDDYMLRYRFLFKATLTGTYYFGTDSDDASEIIMNEGDQDLSHVVIASWYGGHGANGYKFWYHQGSLYLSSGQAIWIEYRMQEWYGGQRAAMGVKAPGSNWKILDADNFRNQIYARSYTSPEPTASIGNEEYNLESLTLFMVQVFNDGNIPITSSTISIGDTVAYPNSSIILEPGESVKISIQLNTLQPGDEYTVFITVYTQDGELAKKQYEVEVGEF